MSKNNEVSLASFGREFQEKLAQLILDDSQFADQISEVIDINFFELKYLQIFVDIIIKHKNEFGCFPNRSTVETILRTELDKQNPVMQKQVRDYFARVLAGTLEDIEDEYVKDKSLDFCKKQKLKEAMIKSVQLMERSSFDEVSRIINNALKLGLDNESGYDFVKHFEERYKFKARDPISTGWDVLDGFIQGGHGKGELGVVVAPTGCHAKGTKILMFDGHFKNVEDILVGDVLMGPDSTPRKVLHLHRGNEEMYKVKPTKGKPFIVNKGHILSLMDTSKNIKNISVFEILNIQKSANRYLFDNKYKLYKVNFNNSKFIRTGFSLSPAGVDDYYGFEVDGDNLYVMEDYFVTHNSGKSMILVHLAAQAMKQGKNVVYYTLELSDTVIARRFDSCLTGVPLKGLNMFKDDIFEKVKQIPGKLIIKEYPTKSVSTETLRAHIKKLEQKDFRVDMVLVDYADLLKPVALQKEKRTELEGIYEELRGIASEMKCPLWTASQTNRSGLNAEVVTMESISEAFNKCFVADFIFSLSRTAAHKQNNTGRIFIAKNRNGPDGVILPIFMDTSNIEIKVMEPTKETIEDIKNNSAVEQAKKLKQKYFKHKEEQKQLISNGGN